MEELGGGLRLAHEPFARLRIVGELGGESLDGNRAVEQCFTREIDDPHPPATELAVERIASCQLGLKVEIVGGQHAQTCTLSPDSANRRRTTCGT